MPTLVQRSPPARKMFGMRRRAAAGADKLVHTSLPNQYWSGHPAGPVARQPTGAHALAGPGSSTRVPRRRAPAVRHPRARSTVLIRPSSDSVRSGALRRPETAAHANICERRDARESREIASQRRSPPQVTDLRHNTNRTRRRGFPRRRAVRGSSSFWPRLQHLTKVVIVASSASRAQSSRRPSQIPDCPK